MAACAAAIDANPAPRLLRCFQQPLLGLFLALDAMPGPGHGFEALGVNLFSAGRALSKAAFADPRQSPIDHIEQLSVVVALAEEEFLVVGTRGAIGNILRSLFVGGAPILLVPNYHMAQFIAPGFQPFSERL